MPITQYKPFANGPENSVTSQGTYESAEWRDNGWRSGILPHQQINKVLRQVTVPISALTQAIADLLGSDVIDDGDVTALTTKIKGAFSAALLYDPGGSYLPGSIGDALQNIESGDFLTQEDLLAQLGQAIGVDQLTLELIARINLIDAPTTGLVTKVADLQATYGSTAAAAASAATAASEAARAIDAANQAAISAGEAFTSKTSATSSKNAAATSASNALSSADSAATAASSAAGSASTASTQATVATNAASTASGHASAAATSASNAATSSANAGSFASAANTSATAAATSAGNASTSASSASTSATNANSSKNSAQTSANNAATSASNALNSATAAAGSASTATTQATNAANSATAANTSATSAASSATAASGSASTAATNASTATTKASEASTSASNANTSRADAEIAQLAAASSQTAAAGSASAAATSASNAATSATNSATSATASNTARTAAETAAGAASTSATQAANSATTAAGSASSASSFASTASTAATNAGVSATAANTSASNAATSATNASGSAAAAADWYNDTVSATGSLTAQVALKADTSAVNGIDARLGVAEANYVMKVSATRSDGKKVFGAIGLAATASGDAGESQILFQADKFVFIPNGANINASPVNVLALGTVNGVTTLMVPAARIGDLTVGTIKIQNEAISSNYLSSISEQVVYSPDYVGEVTTGGANTLTIASGLQSALFAITQGAIESFSNLNVRLTMNTTNARWLDIEIIPYLVNSSGTVIQTGTTALNRVYAIPTRYVNQQFNMSVSQIFSGISAGSYRVRFTVIVRCRNSADGLDANLLLMGVSARIQAINRKV